MSDELTLNALQEELESLRREVRRLSDREAIMDCLHRFSKGLDRLDRELILSAFHGDAIDHHGGFLGGPEEFAKWADDLLRPEWDTSVHFLDLNNLEIDGDTAESECYVFFTQRRVDGQGIDFGGARYLDRLERRHGEWKIAARKLMIEWTSRSPAEVFADVALYPSGSRDRNDASFQRPLQIDAAAS